MIILSLHIFVSSLRSPNTTNVVKDALLLAKLHGTDMLQGRTNVCALILGERAGMMLDAWCAKSIGPLVLAAVIANVLNTALTDPVPTLVATARPI